MGRNPIEIETIQPRRVRLRQAQPSELPSRAVLKRVMHSNPTAARRAIR
jgi:hypothetical protein